MTASTDPRAQRALEAIGEELDRAAEKAWHSDYDRAAHLTRLAKDDRLRVLLLAPPEPEQQGRQEPVGGRVEVSVPGHSFGYFVDPLSEEDLAKINSVDGIRAFHLYAEPVPSPPTGGEHEYRVERARNLLWAEAMAVSPDDPDRQYDILVHEKLRRSGASHGEPTPDYTAIGQRLRAELYHPDDPPEMQDGEEYWEERARTFLADIGFSRASHGGVEALGAIERIREICRNRAFHSAALQLDEIEEVVSALATPEDGETNDG
ncbi:MAG: hypothetical protein AAF389_14755 [Gemmatimonadota bacterium]